MGRVKHFRFSIDDFELGPAFHTFSDIIRRCRAKAQRDSISSRGARINGLWCVC
jgi:hypothetical protein